MQIMQFSNILARNSVKFRGLEKQLRAPNSNLSSQKMKNLGLSCCAGERGNSHCSFFV